MREIKTVAKPIEAAGAFDREVNALLAEGWQLKSREVISAPGLPDEAFHTPIIRVLYAALER